MKERNFTYIVKYISFNANNCIFLKQKQYIQQIHFVFAVAWINRAHVYS